MKLADLHFEDVVALKMNQESLHEGAHKHPTAALSTDSLDGMAAGGAGGAEGGPRGMRRSLSFSTGIMKRHQGLCMALIPT